MEDNLVLVPVVPLRDLVVFPGMVLHFDAGREKSIAAVKTAMDDGSQIFLVAQKDMLIEEPTFNDMFKMGVLCKVRQVVAVPESSVVRVVVEGVSRAELHRGIDDGKYLSALVEPKLEKGYAKSRENHAEALMRKVSDKFEEYASLSPSMSPDILIKVIAGDKPGSMADYIASVLKISFEDKQKILETLSQIDRLEKLYEILIKEVEIQKIDEEITAKVEESLERGQLEYFLHEKMNAIMEELGDTEENEIEAYQNKIKEIKHLDEKSRAKLNKECNRLKKMGPASQVEATVVRNYLDCVLDLPWDKETEDNLDLSHAREVLDKDHYGLDEVKDRIIEILAVRNLNPDIKGQIICLAGPPGVGKTSIAESLARAMGRSFARVSLGGVHDEAEIRGHRRTYIGSMPGRVISAVSDAGTRNPLILFDEIDKMASDMRGDPASAMLEVLDGEQNKAFVDHFVEIPFDLSQVVFVTTANDKNNIPAPLLDRMEVIDLYSYTADEKFNIAKKHLIPKSIKRHGLKAKQLKFSATAIREIIDGYTREAGVRNLERKIDKISRTIACRVVKDINYSITIKSEDLLDILGPAKYKDEKLLQNEVGVVNGLAWTEVGGEMLKVETAVMPGKGELELTGSLGDVMKESAKAAVSYIRTNANKYGISADFYEKKDIHIHVPEGAVPKDGPSAGVTMATSLLSALTGKPVNGKVAMTGEISLTGKVMPIGGLREKTMAAYKSGIKTVVIPKDNTADLKDCAEVVKKNIKFVPVTKLDEVFSEALI